MKRRALTLLSLIISILLLVSCGGGGGGGGNAATTAAATEAATTAAPATTTAAPETTTTTAAPADTGPQKPVNGKYDPPITLTMFRSVDTNRSYMPGESWDNNLWTVAYEERAGIKFDYTQTTMPDEYTNKLNIAIASGDIPEYFKCNYDIFFRLALAGNLADLTGAIKEYGLEAMKANYEANDGLLVKQLSVDGKIHGLAGATDLTGAGQMLWYRDDWAEALNLSEPKTPQDVWDMAYAYAAGDPNGDGSPVVGFGMSKELFDGGMGLNGFFAMDKAWPTIWIEDGQGGVMFGALHENCKITLRKLQEAYKAGVIDNDFINKGAWAEAPDDIVKHKIGMVSGPIWFGDWRCKDVMVALGSNKATWTKMPFPDAQTPYTARPDEIWVINANCKNPEAAVIIGNLTGELMLGSIAEGRYHDQRDPDGNIIDNFFHALGTSFSKITAWNLHCAYLVTEALETGDTSKLNDEMKSYYDRCVSFVNWKPGNPTEELLGYTSYSIFGPGGSEYVGERMDKEGLQKANMYYGPNTNTMNENLGNLKAKRTEIFTAIILGQNVDEGFKEWTSFWSAMNGDIITKEVNDWYKQQ